MDPGDNPDLGPRDDILRGVIDIEGDQSSRVTEMQPFRRGQTIAQCGIDPKAKSNKIGCR